MERQVRLKTDDKHTIYGLLNSRVEGTDRVIIFTHGLDSHKSFHAFHNGAQFFTRKGFDVFRYDLYSRRKGGRLLTDCDVDTHAKDLNRVIDYFRKQKQYKKIFAVGHSLGGPTTVKANTEHLQAIALWEPTELCLKKYKQAADNIRYSKTENAYIIKGRAEYLIGKNMFQDLKDGQVHEFLKRMRVPIKIISAEKGHPRGGKFYLKHAKDPKELVIIEGANHTFDQEGAEEQLFDHTLKWFLKHV